MKTVYLAGGCFWGTQHFIDQFEGICKTTVGYANGKTENPTYSEVCHNDTGHAETVRVEFDESIIPLKTLLRYYFMTIDPLSVNRQGGDTGTQYRTGIYYTDASLLDDIKEVVCEQEKKYGSKLATEIMPLENFYDAEEYHQKYLVKNVSGYCHIPRELMHIQEKLNKGEKI